VKTRHSMQILLGRICDSRRSVWAALCILVAMITAATAQASFTTIMGRGGSYCLVSAQQTIMPEPCVVEQTAFYGCAVSTEPTCTAEHPYAERTSVDAGTYMLAPYNRDLWATSTFIFEGDIQVSIAVSLSGERVSQHLFHIGGAYDLGECLMSGTCQHFEIALIRFDGDPASFEAFDPKTVSDLVAANLIDASDILFVQTDFPDTFGQSTPLDIDVPVTGIRDEDLYLLSSFDTPLPEPAGSTSLGAGVLALAGLVRRWGVRRVASGAKRGERLGCVAVGL